MPLPHDLNDIVLAIGGLGTSAYALVDASKTGKYGGLSDTGFGCIRSLIKAFLVDDKFSQKHVVNKYTVIDQLHAAWINRGNLDEQIKTAKAALKLRFNADSAKNFANVTAIDEKSLIDVATALCQNVALSDAQNAVYAHFDFVLGVMVDAAYQRADQKYRNKAKLYAGVVAVFLAVCSGWVLSDLSWRQFFPSKDCALSMIGGTLAIPLAPVARNLSSVLSAAKDAIQSWGGK